MEKSEIERYLVHTRNNGPVLIVNKEKVEQVVSDISRRGNSINEEAGKTVNQPKRGC